MNELSKTAGEFIKKISDSRVLPYNIKGSWWFISDTICRECETEAKSVTLLKGKDGKEALTESELADRLWKFYDEITAPGEPSQNETEYMKELYDAVQGMDVMYEDSIHDEAMGNLEELLSGLKDEEVEKLIEVQDKKKKLIDYADGCSYRHRS